MVFVKKSTFSSYFFSVEQKEPERNSFLYSGRKKIRFTPEKLSSRKVNKTDILQRGWSWFLAKIPPSSFMFFFSANKARKKHILIFWIV